MKQLCQLRHKFKIYETSVLGRYLFKNELTTLIHHQQRQPLPDDCVRNEWVKDYFIVFLLSSRYKRRKVYLPISNHPVLFSEEYSLPPLRNRKIPVRNRNPQLRLTLHQVQCYTVV